MAHTYIYANLFTSSRRCTAVGFFMVVLLVTVVMLVMVILGVLVFALPAHGGVLAWHGGHVADLG